MKNLLYINDLATCQAILLLGLIATHKDKFFIHRSFTENSQSSLSLLMKLIVIFVVQRTSSNSANFKFISLIA